MCERQGTQKTNHWLFVNSGKWGGQRAFWKVDFLQETGEILGHLLPRLSRGGCDIMKMGHFGDITVKMEMIAGCGGACL